MPVYENTKLILEKIGRTKLVCITKTIDPERINEPFGLEQLSLERTGFRSTRINVRIYCPVRHTLQVIYRQIKSKKPYSYLMLFSQLTP